MTSHLEEEIASQPALIEALLARAIPQIAALTPHLPAWDYALIAARGSSDHAAHYAKYAWAALGGRPVALATPSLHTLYGAPPRMAGALVVGVSQSGQSPDIVAVLAEARRQGRPTLAITNDGGSPLAATADEVIELGVGPERSVAATKTYTAELAVIAACAAALSADPARLEELRQLPEALAATLALAGEIAPRAERYRFLERCVVIGRGYNYATAFELALKLKELTYLMAIPYSSADFRHGPIAATSPGDAALLVMPSGRALDDLLELAHDLKAMGVELLVISDALEALALATTPLPFAAPVPEWLSPIAAVLPGQSLALRLALAKGLDPDAPRAIQKVTRTR
ncbi:MAG TPA: SIS domain-containing protein [Ktedonobacterales bacterium]